MKAPQDPAFEIEFYERILRRDPLQIDVMRQLGHLYTRAGKLGDGLRVDRALAVLCPEDPVAHYNLACSYALLARDEEALLSLADALRLGYRDLDHIRNDPDLARLRKDPRFRALLERGSAQAGRSGASPQ